VWRRGRGVEALVTAQIAHQSLQTGAHLGCDCLLGRGLKNPSESDIHIVCGSVFSPFVKTDRRISTIRQIRRLKGQVYVSQIKGEKGDYIEDT